MRLATTEIGSGPPVALLHGLFGAGGNLRAVARALAGRHRVVSLDLRNHGGSPHAFGMDYGTLAGDVLDTLAGLDALPAVLLGHSMGGKVAMRAALDRPEAATRLLVADIAPVRYPPAFRPYVEAMAALRLHPGLGRAEADAVLAPAVESPGVRAFLLQNLRFDAVPAWRIGLAEIAAGLPDVEGWPAVAARYNGPTLFVAGQRSDYIRPDHRAVIRTLFPRSRFATVRDAGHWLHADQPEAFAAVAAGFLSD